MMVMVQGGANHMVQKLSQELLNVLTSRDSANFVRENIVMCAVTTYRSMK